MYYLQRCQSSIVVLRHRHPFCLTLLDGVVQYRALTLACLPSDRNASSQGQVELRHVDMSCLGSCALDAWHADYVCSSLACLKDRLCLQVCASKSLSSVTLLQLLSQSAALAFGPRGLHVQDVTGHVEQRGDC